jgi:EAL domain-containing protein (putative c-di-GMP-specific phosphodiesterase class I)
LTLAVPLSVRQLERPNLVERMMELLVASNFDSTLFQLELAGSLLLQDAKYLRGVLERFRELGIRVAINEFGAGYTSLRQLAQLPIDTLKVDRSFIAGVPSDPELMSIVESMVQMGDSLGLTIVAEGVESREQFDFLREIGCHQCQGDLIGEAISAADFGRCLKEDPCSVHFLHDKRTGVPIILCEPDTKWI